MELTLLGTAGLAAFLIGGAGVLIVASFRRTIALREALISALKRIERLEAQLALDPSQRTPTSQAPLQEFDQPPLRTPLIPVDAPAPVAQKPATLEPALRLETPQQAEPRAQTYAPVARAGLPAPSANMVMFGAGLASFASLAAAQVHAVSGLIGVALALLFALCAFACAEWRRQTELADERHTFRVAPHQASIMALFSVGLVLVALGFGRSALNAPAPELAFALSAFTALAAAFLASRFGAWMISASLICALFTPTFLNPAASWAPIAQASFVIVHLGLIAILAHQRQTPIWLWIGGAIALFWITTGLMRPEPPTAWIFACAILVIIGIGFAWEQAKATQAPPRPLASLSAPQTVITGTLLTLAACCLFLCLLLSHRQSGGAGAALLIIALATTIGAALRPLLQPTALIGALTAIAALAFWPNNTNGVVNIADLLFAGASLGLVFSIAGGATLFHANERAAGAYLAALAPIGVLAALHQRLDAFGGEMWAMAALSLAILNALAYVQWAKSKPNLATPFATGAALAISAALYVAVPERAAGFALTLALPLFAALEFWRPERGLRLAALILTPLAALALIAPEIANPAASTPILIALSFGVSAIAALAGAHLFETGPARAKSLAAQAALALCLFLMAMMGSLIARHAFTAGAIGAPFSNLGELGVHLLIWLSLAVLMAWRLPKRGRRILFGLEVFAAGVALTLSLVAGLIVINPWWGLSPAAAPSWNGLSVIFLAYGAPAVLMLTYAQLRGRDRMETRAGLALAAGLVMLFAAITLELRRFYHGAHMAQAPILPAEALAYTAAWIGIAALMFALSAERHGRLLRYGSLALALFALGKTALFDLGSLNGVARLAAFVALVGAGGGLIWFYRRFVLPGAPAQPKTDSIAEPAKTLADPAPTPPG